LVFGENEEWRSGWGRGQEGGAGCVAEGRVPDAVYCFVGFFSGKRFWFVAVGVGLAKDLFDGERGFAIQRFGC
jgi:hypothetical protein